LATQASVDAIESKLDNQSAFMADVDNLATQASVDAIEAKLDDPTMYMANVSGLASQTSVNTVMADVAIVEAKLDDPTAFMANVSGLATQSSVDAIETKLDDPTQYRANVSNLALQSTVDSLTTSVTAIETKLNDPSTGLAEIKSEVADMETRLTSIENTLALILNAVVQNCGNGNIDPGEQCDDGNQVSGDGCSANCVIEYCGDGIVNDVNEECDDGNQVSGDGCSANCVIEYCGDGIVNDVNEECEQDADCSPSEECQSCECIPIGCFNDSFCQADGYGDNYCINGDVYHDYLDYTCIKPGVPDSYCNHTNSAPELVENCDNITEMCQNGACVPKAEVIFRTNAENGAYASGTWVAVDTNDDKVLEGYDYTGSTGLLTTCKGTWLVNTTEGYGVYLDAGKVYVCKPSDGKYQYKKYYDASATAVTIAVPIEPYASNDQEVYA
jgi:cysteine-rich repeat protein